jgi:NitT/TauT family transport system permease protein/putative hydroxymethylpyrimidine transport system permease protein
VKRAWLAPALVVAVLVGAWELIVRAGLVDPLLLPAPTHVVEALWTDRSLLAPDLWTTTTEVVIGLFAALILGAGLAVAMHLFAPVDRALRPLVIGSQAVPIPVIAPLFVFVLGFGLAPKLLIVALVCFFPVTINLYDGLRASCCARSTRRAGRRCASWRRRRRCRPRSPERRSPRRSPSSAPSSRS